MKTADFNYHLPEDHIAYYPLPDRAQSQLLILNREDGAFKDKHFADVIDYLNPGDMLVMNNSRVLKARLYGHKPTGAKVELLIERVLDPKTAWCHVKTSKALKPGGEVVIQGANSHNNEMAKLVCEGREGDLFVLSLQAGSVGANPCVRPEVKNDDDCCLKIQSFYDLMNQAGHMPLPPYIQREDELSDEERYQTVYSKELGSVAAPTAGLHFTDALIEKIKAKGVQIEFLTLHVGAGTFQPVRVEDVNNHIMHSEVIDVPETLCDKINVTKQKGNKVIAVGTTSVRSLETAAQSGELKPYQGETDIFIYPGFEFKVIDGMITNFHLPESTLLMLVSAFAGKTQMMDAYAHAIEHEYRFFSYGDAMLIM